MRASKPRDESQACTPSAFTSDSLELMTGKILECNNNDNDAGATTIIISRNRERNKHD